MRLAKWSPQSCLRNCTTKFTPSRISAFMKARYRRNINGQESITMLHAGGACFELECIVGQTPVIRDLNGRCSVTNPAEAVVTATLERLRDMAKNYAGPGHAQRPRPRAIVYRDSS